MTDRIRSFTVVLDREMRTDDAEVISTAISMIKGVLSVTPGQPTSPAEHAIRVQLMAELRSKLIAVLTP